MPKDGKNKKEHRSREAECPECGWAGPAHEFKEIPVSMCYVKKRREFQVFSKFVCPACDLAIMVLFSSTPGD